MISACSQTSWWTRRISSSSQSGKGTITPLQWFRFSGQIALYPVDLQPLHCIALFDSLDGLCDNLDIDAVRCISQSLYKELVIFFPFYVPGIATIDLQVADLQVVQLSKRIKSPAKVINSAATADSIQALYCRPRALYISQYAIFRKFH